MKRDDLEKKVGDKWRAYWNKKSKIYYQKNRAEISKKRKEKRKLSKTAALETELS